MQNMNSVKSVLVVKVTDLQTNVFLTDITAVKKRLDMNRATMYGDMCYDL